MIAASTGPLHVAAALGKKAIGIYSPKRPIHPGRWMPLGNQAKYIVYDMICEDCLNTKDCDCIEDIPVQGVFELIRE